MGCALELLVSVHLRAKLTIRQSAKTNEHGNPFRWALLMIFCFSLFLFLGLSSVGVRSDANASVAAFVSVYRSKW